jgi:ubiquinone/menaquinone biosynthesis C-methylase UbiE
MQQTDLLFIASERKECMNKEEMTDQNDRPELSHHGQIIKKRKPEKSEMFPPEEAETYIVGCDFDKTSDYAIVAAELVEAFGNNGAIHGVIVEVCPGPGNLCEELLSIGADKVIGIDGDPVMIAHTKKKFQQEIANGQMEFWNSLAQNLPLANNSVDGVVNFNSFHQFGSEERALQALKEMARILKPNGWGLVRDFKRGGSDEAIAKRLEHTREKIKPLLLDSLEAAFTAEEFSRMLTQIPGIEFSVTDTENPWRLSEILCDRMRNDPVEHWRDFGISQHVIIKKI